MSYCLKQYFKFHNESCWIDSLFVALFHNSSYLIEDFVKNLKLNNINESYKEINLGNKIIDEIKNIYKKLNKDEDEDKVHNTNNIIRKLLNDHLILMKTSRKVDVSEHYYNSFESVTNNSVDLLKYLFYYIFDTNSSNKITSYYSNFYDYMNNKNMLNYHTNTPDESPEYKNINFINLAHKMSNYESLLEYKLKDKLDNLSLHSIIANVKSHYICYYKCEDEWYKYDDMGIEQYRKDGKFTDRTILIGNLEDVMKDYHNIIKKKNEELESKKINTKIGLEIILLYLDLGQRQRLGLGPGPDPSPVARSQEHYRIELARQREIVRQRLIKEAREREEKKAREESDHQVALQLKEKEEREIREEREARKAREERNYELALQLIEREEREEREAREKDLINKKNKKIEEINLKCKEQEEGFTSACSYEKNEIEKERQNKINNMQISYQDPNTDKSFFNREIEEINKRYDNKIKEINNKCYATINNIIQKCDKLIEETNDFFNSKLNNLKYS